MKRSLGCICLLSLHSSAAAAAMEASPLKFVLAGNNGGSDIQVENVGSGLFSPSKMTNWHYDRRFPLVPPNAGGSCPGNIYNGNAVNNGGSTWNVYFGGWDGVSSCHDSVSVTVTEDAFSHMNAHDPMVSTGSVVHLNNPSVVKVGASKWAMVYTQLSATTNLNKPGLSFSTDGINWEPNTGGVSSAYLQMHNYSNWEQADVNGGNVLQYDANTDTYHLYFVDFKQPKPAHSVFHATAPGSYPTNFTFRNVAVVQPGKVVNDLKYINGYWVMSLHANAQQTWFSVSGRDLSHRFPQPQTLFSHRNEDDFYIVSVGMVIDSNSSRLLGSVYGAGATSALDNNRLFATWLQRQVLFQGNEGTLWGLGNASQALGPNAVAMAVNVDSLQGNFYVYDSDYVDANNRGTLLGRSQTVTVKRGDVWSWEV